MKYFFINLCLACIIQVSGQSNFVFKYGTEKDEVPFDFIEMSDGYIIVSEQGTYPTVYNSLFFKLNFNGDTIASKIVSNPGITTIFQNLVKSSDSSFFCIGTKTYNSNTNLYILKMNYNLEIEFDREYNIGLQYIDLFKGLINHNGNLVIYGCGREQDSLWRHPFIYCLNQEGDSLFYNFYCSPTSQRVSSMMEKSDTSGYVMVFSGHYQIPTYTGGQFLTFDNSFQVTSIDSIPQYLILYNDLKIYNQSHFLMSGHYHKDDCKFAIYLYDTTMIYEKKILFGGADTINYPGYLYNLDLSDTNHIFLGGTVNQSLSLFSPTYSYLMLSRFDSDLDLIWQRYYGGDMYYNLWAMRCTSDGGAILLGTSYNYFTQNSERDIYLIKTDSLGIVTGIKKKNRNTLSLLIYPNPGNDIFNIKISEKPKDLILIVYDFLGNEIFRKKINFESTEIDMSKMKKGIYFWNLFSDNILESGKWIKL